MFHKIKYLLVLCDDPEDHFFFSNVISGHFPGINLTLLDACDQLMPYLMDMRIAFPDIIMLDLDIIGNQDLECLIELKKTKNLAHIPVVVYSSTKRRSQVNLALELGAYKYIVKSGNFNEGLTQLTNLLLEVEQL